MRAFLVFTLIAGLVGGLCSHSMALDPFFDDFNRPDDKDLGNDWVEDDNHGIETVIENNEVIIKGTEDQDWAWVGFTRTVNDIESVFFDYLAVQGLQIHLRIRDTGTGAFIALYCPAQLGATFRAANTPDGAWPGWQDIGGSNLGEYNTLGIVKVDKDEFQPILNDEELLLLENKGLKTINEVYISVDAAAGVSGEAHVDNVSIDGGTVQPPKLVEPRGKLPTVWARVRNSYR